jgi:hypothetical protein
MDIRHIIKSQYRASLAMLEDAIEHCSHTLWYDQGYTNRFWHIAYHALFYTHLYLQASGQEFVPWSKSRKEYEFLGPLPWPPHREPDIREPYSKQDILGYLGFCRNEVEERVPCLNLEAASGFDWLPINKLELQFYNLRHLQLHVGQLVDRLRNVQGIGIGWVGAKPEGG